MSIREKSYFKSFVRTLKAHSTFAFFFLYLMYAFKFLFDSNLDNTDKSSCLRQRSPIDMLVIVSAKRKKKSCAASDY